MIWFIFGGKLVALLFFEVFKLLLLHFLAANYFQFKKVSFLIGFQKLFFLLDFEKDTLCG